MDAYAETLIRIRNWARWCLQGSGRQGHCLSIEHRYRSPQWGHWDAIPPAIPSPIDVLDAIQVQEAFSRLPWRQRIIIGHHYVRRWQDAWICRRIGTSRNNYPELHDFALFSLQKALNVHAQRSKVRDYNLEIEPKLLFAA